MSLSVQRLLTVASTLCGPLESLSYHNQSCNDLVQCTLSCKVGTRHVLSTQIVNAAVCGHGSAVLLHLMNSNVHMQCMRIAVPLHSRAHTSYAVEKERFFTSLPANNDR